MTDEVPAVWLPCAGGDLVPTVIFVCPFCGDTRDWNPHRVGRAKSCGAYACRYQRRMIAAAARLWARVQQSGPDDCWLWQGHVNNNGYGTIHSDGGDEYVHRVAYALLKGPVPAGLELDHLCRNTRCVNPAHLEAVPHKVNSLRGISLFAMEARQTHCIHGHRFDGANTYIRKDNGARQCRQCKADRMRRRSSSPRHANSGAVE